MADQENQENNLIDDRIITELEKISTIQNAQKSLSKRTNVIQKDVQQLKLSVLELKEDEEDDKNVIETEELKPYLNELEKKRYSTIGQEFMKGAAEVFNQIKKAKELKEKMSTNNKEVQALQKIEDEKKNQEDQKKKKTSPFLVLGIAIAAVGTMLYLFRDKLKDAFDKAKDVGNNFDSFSSSLSNFGGSVIERILTAIVAEIHQFFNETGPIGNLIDSFFTKTLPNSIKYAGIHLISLFSEGAAKSLESTANQASTRSDKEVNESVTRHRYDAVKATRDSAQLSGAGGASEGALRSMLSNLAVTSIEEELKSKFIPLLNQKLFKGTQDENEKMAVAFQERTYNIKAFMEEFASTSDEKIVALRERIKSGRVTDDDKRQLAEMMGNNFGVEVDENYINQVSQEFFNGDVANESAKQLLKSADTFIEQTKRIETSIASTRAASAAREQRIKDKQKELMEDAQTFQVDTVKIGEVTLGNSMVSEVKKFAELAQNMVSGDITIAQKIIEKTNTFLKEFITNSVNNIFSIIEQITKGLPFLSGSGMVTSGNSYDEKYSKHSNADKLTGDTRVSGSKTETLDLMKLKEGTRPLVIVSLSLDGTVLSKITSITNNQMSILENIKKSNECLSNIINEIDAVSTEQDSSDQNDNETMGIVQKINSTLNYVIDNSKRITNIENYLEANDNDNIGETTANFEAQTKTPQNK